MRSRLIAILFLSMGLYGSVSAQFFLSGKISNPNGVGVFNVDIDMFDSNTGDPIGLLADSTDSMGNYNLDPPFGLPAGTYDIAFKPPAGSGLAPVINRGYVFSGNQVLNDTVPFGFTLSGFVRDINGNGLANIDLNVDDELTGQRVFTPGDKTDFTGFYSLVLQSGLYTLTYRPVSGEKLVAAEFKGVVFNSTQTRDVILQPGFFVSGRVQDNNGQPVVDADLDFDISSTGERVPTPNDNTNEGGDYQVVVPAGTYNITVEPQVSDKLVAGKIFSFVVSNDINNVNFTLQPGFFLSGTVRRASNMTVVAGVDIDVEDTITGLKIPTPGDATDAAGFYQTVVPAGGFNVVFQPPAATGLASVESLRVTVSTDRTLDANLPNGVTLSGTAQRTGGGGLANVDIRFENPATGAKIPLANHFTNALGNYAVVAVPGSYTVEFEPPKAIRRVAKEFPNFSLNANLTLNVTLDSGRSVSGFIKDSLNNPLFEVDFDAFIPPSGTEVFTPSDNTDSAGYYEAVIPPRTFDLAYTPPLASRFTGASFTGASITKDTTINLTLRHGVQLSGTVRGSDGNPLAGVKVRAFGSPEAPLAKGMTDDLGQYAGILVPGTYQLRYVLSSGLDSVVLSGVTMRIDTVVEVSFGPHPPVLASIGNKFVLAGRELAFNVSASDPDGTTPSFSITGLPSGAIFFDSLNGRGRFSWTPTLSQVGNHDVTFTASDGSLTDSEPITIAVIDPSTVRKGDLNLDGNLSAADIVFLIGCTFSQSEPPAGFGACDLNCNGSASGADIVILITAVFNQGSFPC
ncbi:MAG: carboxypeptidase regulatory-like domain-containing protein [candidate division Zixibacteria bacterium]|nr:carboxypeptidase regulatory-like domain-containing protein [candidate division Zixibacteria bacterium]